jgi:hypothetical protein
MKRLLTFLILLALPLAAQAQTSNNLVKQDQARLLAEWKAKIDKAFTEDPLPQFTQQKDSADLKQQIDMLKAELQKFRDRTAELEAKGKAQPVQAKEQKKDGNAWIDNTKLPRGANPTPLHKILHALRMGTAVLHTPPARAPPPQVIVVPPTLSMLGNDRYGDCVSAGAAFKIEAYSVQAGLSELVVSDQTVVSWASAHGVLNGADLLSVFQWIQKDGMKAGDGKVYTCGVPAAVDWTNETTLQNAIAQGPLGIAISASVLPSGAGNKSGWYVFGNKGGINSTDHCVVICGYGKLADLAKALGISVPSGQDPNKVCYLVYTWSTIGIVDHDWIMGTVPECWLSTPTVNGLPAPQPPQPPQPPTPGPAFPWTATVTFQANGTATWTPGAPVAPSYKVTVNPDGSIVLTPATGK